MVEFKSDRKCLSDKELINAVVALANTDGGIVFLGVEDDGTPTGLHPNHRPFEGVSRLVANRTVPALAVEAWTETVSGREIGVVRVPKSNQLVATSDGLLLHRRIRPLTSSNAL